MQGWKEKPGPSARAPADWHQPRVALARNSWIQMRCRCWRISPAPDGVESGTWKAARKARQKAARWPGERALRCLGVGGRWRDPAGNQGWSDGDAALSQQQLPNRAHPGRARLRAQRSRALDRAPRRWTAHPPGRSTHHRCTGVAVGLRPLYLLDFNISIYLIKHQRRRWRSASPLAGSQQC